MRKETGEGAILASRIQARLDTIHLYILMLEIFALVSNMNLHCLDWIRTVQLFGAVYREDCVFKLVRRNLRVFCMLILRYGGTFKCFNAMVVWSSVIRLFHCLGCWKMSYLQNKFLYVFQFKMWNRFKDLRYGSTFRCFNATAVWSSTISLFHYFEN